MLSNNYDPEILINFENVSVMDFNEVILFFFKLFVFDSVLLSYVLLNDFEEYLYRFSYNLSVLELVFPVNIQKTICTRNIFSCSMKFVTIELNDMYVCDEILITYCYRLNTLLLFTIEIV